MTAWLQYVLCSATWVCTTAEVFGVKTWSRIKCWPCHLMNILANQREIFWRQRDQVSDLIFGEHTLCFPTLIEQKAGKVDPSALTPKASFLLFFKLSPSLSIFYFPPSLFHTLSFHLFVPCVHQFLTRSTLLDIPFFQITNKQIFPSRTSLAALSTAEFLLAAHWMTG